MDNYSSLIYQYSTEYIRGYYDMLLNIDSDVVRSGYDRNLQLCYKDILVSRKNYLLSQRKNVFNRYFWSFAIVPSIAVDTFLRIPIFSPCWMFAGVLMNDCLNKNINDNITKINTLLENLAEHNLSPELTIKDVL